MDYYFANGQQGVVVRKKLRSVSTQNGKTGMAFNTSGLVISTIADNEATPSFYTAAGSTIQAVTTLGAFAAPTAGSCRFSQVDATHNPGVYEIQLDNSRYAVSGAKHLRIDISGVSDLREDEIIVLLTVSDPYNPYVQAYYDLYADQQQAKAYFGNVEPPQYSPMNSHRTNNSKRETTSRSGYLTVWQEAAAGIAFQLQLSTDANAQPITDIG